MKEKIAEMKAQVESLKTEIKLEQDKEQAYNAGTTAGVFINEMIRGMVDAGSEQSFAENVVLAYIKAGKL